MTLRDLAIALAIATGWAGFGIMAALTATPTDVALRCLGY